MRLADYRRVFRITANRFAMIRTDTEIKMDKVLTPDNIMQDKSGQPPGLFAWLKRELIIFLGLAVIGLTLVPLSIYLVGKRVLGNYGDGGILKDLYADLYTRFIAFEPGAWILLLGPWLFITFIRFLYLPLKWKRRPKTLPTES